MLTVTESAKTELKRVSSQALDQPETVLRLTADETGRLSLVVDNEKENDQVVKDEEATVLVIDEQLSTALDGVSIDYQDTEAGPRFILIRSKPEESTEQD